MITKMIYQTKQNIRKRNIQNKTLNRLLEKLVNFINFNIFHGHI